MLILFLLALIGLIVSAALHFSTYWGMGWQASMPYVWLLGIGVFVVWVPAVAIQGMMPRAHHFPAVCPKCGGHAFWTNNRGTPYRCADCGWIG